MKYLAVAAVAAIVLCASAAAAREDVVLMSDSGALGASRAGTLGWERVGATPSTMELDFLFALTNRNVDVLEDTLFKVSDPNSPSFREYLTFDEVRDLTAPTKATVELVLDFVKRAGATRTELLPSGDALRVHMTAADAARMFNTPRGFHEFHHAGTKQTLHRTVEHYSLPRDVAAVVDFVGGVSRLPRAKMAVHAGLHAVDQAHAPSSGNAPVVFGISGGAVENAFFMPLCADGSPVKLTGGCGLSTVQLSWTVPSGATASTNGSATEFCGPCSQFKGRVLAIDEATACATKDKSLGYAATYCAMQVDDATLGAPAAATVQVQYTDGSLSSPSTQTIIGQPYATPSFLKNMYSVPTTVHKTGPLQAVVEFSDQFYSPKDLAAYQARYNISMTSPVVINGLNDPSNPGLEASLDIQVITAIAENFPTQFWTTSGLRNNSAPPSDGNQEPFQRWLTRLMQFPDGQVPLVNSVSYDDDEYALPVGFTDYLNVQFMKAGSRGLTLLFAAGDDGVGGEGVRDHGPSMCPVFRPAFPATSPYVTAVGGTQVLRVPATAADLTEVVSDSVTGSIITSGGGFSNRFPAPSYQVEAVHGFLTNPSADLPPASYYNASGRGYPDITAFATNYPIIINGSWWQIGGTSASTPLIAGQISLMNQILQAAGAKPMGFINPGIYALGQAPFFTDITVGNNKCSAVPTNCCPYGFKATVGWDSCSGVGSPNFAELVKVLAL